MQSHAMAAGGSCAGHGGGIRLDCEEPMLVVAIEFFLP
jgi:hypothetical protein